MGFMYINKSRLFVTPLHLTFCTLLTFRPKDWLWESLLWKPWRKVWAIHRQEPPWGGQQNSLGPTAYTQGNQVCVYIFIHTHATNCVICDWHHHDDFISTCTGIRFYYINRGGADVSNKCQWLQLTYNSYSIGLMLQIQIISQLM